ncbi:UPF0716 protein FxsA [Neisseria sp. HSC-16F19]|nr:FxsA family protein [Neisseria sp. HSC-16F19]MCP2040562.1 UPF0716 protein FxsA [Neisseria sp. HSC-16F19]
MRFIPWLLIALAVLEVVSIVLMADWLGGGLTLLLMLVGLIVGVLMLRNIGFSAALMAAETMRSRENISLYQMLWPIRFIVAALLLITPGFASDAAALLLMLPLKGKPLPEGSTFHQGPRRPQGDDIIEGEYTVHDPDHTAPTSQEPPRQLPER